MGLCVVFVFIYMSVSVCVGLCVVFVFIYMSVSVCVGLCVDLCVCWCVCAFAYFLYVCHPVHVY